ncbi:pirin family protein [uncultured Amnibacterium sp.]|uniref:pirin family protein n=1 Tax=uncultured Amnibacterium sp. TaxID=1631851 RepID=UPI0035C96716
MAEEDGGMSVTERDPALIEVRPEALGTPIGASLGTPRGTPRGAPQLLLPREVPLGGPRAMLVNRTLPQRGRSLIGAWCFIDHYGPHDLADGSPGMRVPGHPHIGLQTVTWLFEGEIEHRDTTGATAIVRPGELNLMTAGDGVAHSEHSTPRTRTVHGVQLWVALPDGARTGAAGFEHQVPQPFASGAATVRVFLGSWLGASVSASTFTTLFGAEVLLPAGATWHAALDRRHETGVLVDRGAVTVQGIDAVRTQLVALPAGNDSMTIQVDADSDARLIVLGGEPFPDPVVMWWNFVGRDHDEIVRARDDWQRQVSAQRETGTAQGRFGRHPDEWDDVLAAPELPTVRLKPRS